MKPGNAARYLAGDGLPVRTWFSLDAFEIHGVKEIWQARHRYGTPFASYSGVFNAGPYG